MVVPGFWERWFYSEDGRSLSHRGFNEQQWGAVLAAGAPGDVRRKAGADFFESGFGISESRSKPKAVYAGLIHLGVNESTESAWQASQHRILERLEAHFSVHDYILGGKPSLADYGLLGPLYAHLYRDAVPGFALRTHFPLVAEWVERTNGEGALNSRSYGQRLYSLDADGELVGRVANSDGGEWLPDDALAESLLPVLEVFFEEMWPVLQSSMRVLSEFIASPEHQGGEELPGKSFTVTPGFEALQTGTGALTHDFEIGGIRERRMVMPYQVWMLQRISTAMDRFTDAGRESVASLLASFKGGPELGALASDLAHCRLRKEGARIYSA